VYYNQASRNSRVVSYLLALLRKLAKNISACLFELKRFDCI
jgi:hypothetical protein